MSRLPVARGGLRALPRSERLARTHGLSTTHSGGPLRANPRTGRACADVESADPTDARAR
jgi:hypothetical protein